MPRYDFKNISSKIKVKSKQDLSITLDGKDFLDESINKRFIKKIEYTCPYGSILIEGIFDLSKLEIQDIISFKNLSIKFSPELKLAYKQEFENPKIDINFKLSLDNEETIRKHINVLKRIFNELDTDYKSFIKFKLDSFVDVNILEMLDKIGEEEKNKYLLGIEEIKEEKKNFLEINDDIDDNLDEEDINNKSEVINFFPLSPKKEKEDENEIKEEKNIIKKINYIKVKDLDKFNLDDKKVKIESKVLKKYFMSDKNKLKEKISKDLLMPTNFNQFLFKIETNKEKIEFKNVFINDDLKQLNSKYKRDILSNFVDLLLRHPNYNNEKNLLTINDYTNIVLSFMKTLEKEISEIKRNNMKESEYRYYIQRLKKINSSLSLFHILFLNCFYSSIDDKDKFEFENEELYDDFFSLKVQTMRKKNLIDWCIKEESNYINKNDLINININKRKEVLTRQIMSFGQIKTAIKANKNKNLFINSKLSNLNQNTSNKTLSYFLKKQNASNEINKEFISYKANDGFSDKINNSWISYLLQSLLYKEKPNEYITKSINLIEEKIKDMDEISKPCIKGVFQLNYVLLKLYEKIINGSKEIKSIEEYLNMLSNNNLLGRSNSDHFCQYIISYILTKVIYLIIPDLNEDDLLYKNNYFLLIQIISEILSIDINDNKDDGTKIMNLIIRAKLLTITRINKKIKQKIFVDIISHQNLSSIDSFWKEYKKENIQLIDEFNKEYINGIYYLNNNNLLLAYKSLIKSEKYKEALNVYLKYFFSLIKEINIKINFKESCDNLQEIYEKAPYLFNDFYYDFLMFIILNAKKEDSDVHDIINLLKKFLYEYAEKNKNIYLDENSHRFIVKTLCDLLLEKNKQDENLILCGELRLNELENIYFENKNNFWNYSLKDVIEHKNRQFSVEEY